MIQDSELQNLYQIESEERLEKLEAGLLHLQEHPDDETTIEDLLHEAHRLKADSNIIELENVETLTEAIEKVLRSIKNQKIVFNLEVCDRLYQGLHAIRSSIHSAVTLTPSEIDHQAVLDSIESILNPQRSDEIAPTYIEDSELRDVYKISSEERLQTIEEGLLHLEKHPNDQTILESLLREAHSLKGDSRIAELENVENLTHAFEDILQSIKRTDTILTPDLCDRLYQGLDGIRSLVHEAVTGSPSNVNTQNILNSLRGIGQDPQTAATVDFIEDSELRDIYQISSEERLQKLEEGLLHLEKYPDDQTILSGLLREAHSLKGDSRIVDLDNVENLTHAFEDILGSIKRTDTALTPELCDRLYQTLDAIRSLVHEAVTGIPSNVNTQNVLQYLRGQAQPQGNLGEKASTIQDETSSPAEKIPVQANQNRSSPDESYRIDTIRVETRHLDALITQTGELTVTKIRMAHNAQEIEEVATIWENWKASRRKGQNFNSSSEKTQEYEECLEQKLAELRNSAVENSSRLDLIAEELEEKIRNLRLLPLSTVFQLFPRMVRDLARQESKQVELIVEGGETTADKNILEKIKDSLMHIVRNSVDHGIETPAERERLGKPPTATIWLRAYQTATNIVIEVADDGIGLDIESIKQTAVSRGLYTREQLSNMNPKEIHSLIFAAGFSTRNFITEISGRGVGLDVVRTNIEELKGNIDVESTYGKGCTFRIQMGTTLTTAHVMLVEVEGIVHALPIEFVERNLLVSPDDIFTIEGRDTIALDGEAVRVGYAIDLLELSNSLPDASSKVKQQNPMLSCVLLKVGEEQFGLFVDGFLDAQEVVIKAQSKLLKRVRSVSGATILGTGEVCMILNPPDLLKIIEGAKNIESLNQSKGKG